MALACTILDGASFRPGRGGPMSVTPAKFELKIKPEGVRRGRKGSTDTARALTLMHRRCQETGAKKPKASGGGGGASGPATKKRKAGAGGGGGADKKALGWDGFDDVADPRRVVVVLRHMFAPAELAAAGLPGAADALREEIVAEAARFGAVDKARVFEHNPEGVVTVKFREPSSADACRARMHGRWFGGRTVEASLYDGRTDFGARAQRAETEEEQAARLERYAAELEAGFAADA